MSLIESLTFFCATLEKEAHDLKDKAARTNRLEAAFLNGQAKSNMTTARRLRALYAEKTRNPK